MSTSVEAKVARSLGYDSLSALTLVPLVAITPNGVLFDGDLTDTEIGDVWWFVTSRDDADRARREAIAADVAAAEAGTHGVSWLNDAYAALGRYVLGLQ